jgi:protein-S-isoprenylcysteine O-methyltransferase Ste14
MHAAIELALILSKTLSPNSSATERLFDFLFMSNYSKNCSISIPPVRFAVGMAVVIGGFIRWLSYREMGRHFTYHVTILKEHRLVTTGPYSFVRHPGYTGGFIVQAGILFWHGATGSWLRESDVYRSPIAWLVIVLCLSSVILTLKMYAERPQLEDAVLRKEFGKQWDEWARNVPYKILPGVF